MSKKTVVNGILLFVAGAGLGYGVGYFATRKRLEAYVDREIQSVKDTYAPFRKEGVFATPEGAVSALIPDEDVPIYQQVIAEEGYSDILENAKVDEEYDDSEDEDDFPGNPEDSEEEESIPELEHHNVWDEHGPKHAEEPEGSEVIEGEIVEDEDEEPEVLEVMRIFPRDPDHPYIISEHQFMDDGMHPDDKMDLLYFEEDDTLTDDHEHILNNVEYLVGIDNLGKFGLGSGDRRKLYIRNEKTGADYEVIKDERSFTEAVLGVPPESPVKSRTLRMRDDDQ
jgi:hypothetical protein